MTDLHQKSYSKDTPCLATLKERRLVTGPLSIKPTYHISLAIEDTGLHFQPGDSLAIFPQNDPNLTRKVLQALQIAESSPIVDPRSALELSALAYFTSKVNIAKVTPSLVKHLIAHYPHYKIPSALAEPENKDLLLAFATDHDICDLISLHDASPIQVAELLPFLSPLLPRFYSISSSLTVHKDEVHLLVALASHAYKKEIRHGIASHFLCNLAVPDVTRVPIYVQSSRHFSLPKDPAANIIMIGPGTGVAPYRAFLQERCCMGASGKNWLFFGGRYKDHDFLYKDLWTKWEEKGQLRLCSAFSRDQARKEYVQHHLLEHGKEIFRWIEDGAYIYVCGDATHMAKDVEATCITILEVHGNMTKEQAKARHKQLKAERRYLTDVY